MDFHVTFPGGERTEVRLASGELAVPRGPRDRSGGDGFRIFLASVATNAGDWVLGYCRSRELPVAGLRLVQRARREPGSDRLVALELELRVPEELSDRHRRALLRAVQLCPVVRAFSQPPEVSVRLQRG